MADGRRLVKLRKTANVKRQLGGASDMLFWYHVIMKEKAKSLSRKSRGRPATGKGGASGRAMVFRVSRKDRHLRRRQADLPGRPEAIRRLVDLGLEAKIK